MKGKAKYLNKLFLIIAVLMTACVCVIGIAYNKSEPTYAAFVTELNNQRFSHVDENGIIMSVEKVAVSNNPNRRNEPFTAVRGGSSVDFEKMMAHGDKELYYSDIPSGEDEKYVVYKDQYVMLNNTRKVSGGDVSYETTSVVANDPSNQPAAVEEAIMISLGQYVWDEENIVKSADLKKPGIVPSNISSVALKVYALNANGEVSTNTIAVNSARSYSDTIGDVTVAGQDFVCIITQKNAIEGYYEFTTTYYYNGIKYTATFGFYLLFYTNYNGTVEVEGHPYSIDPNFRLGNDIWSADTNGEHHYTIGSSDNIGNLTEYPVLTYDYAKYDLSYTHTANGVITEYEYTLGAVPGRGECIILTKKTSTETVTEYYVMNFYHGSSENSLVSVVFTEMGRYSINFKYVYRGYTNQAKAPEINLTMDSKELYIHGFELKYGKDGYNEAQMRHLTFAAHSSDKQAGVDLIVPNGYNSNKDIPSVRALGVVYDLDTASTERTGSVVRHQDAHVTGFDDIPSSHVKTNQGPLWLATNDGFNMSGSYYYHSYDGFPNPTTATREALTNSTSFTKVGYYLVAVEVVCSNYIKGAGPHTYMQYFAFEYVANSIDMKMEIVDDNGTTIKQIGSNGYTNQNVVVSWVTPGIFEREISAKYYTIKDQFTTKEHLLTTSGISFDNGAKRFTDEGSYLIELKSEGATSTYTMFTIDRQSISGVSAYGIEVISIGNSKAYTFERNNKGSAVALDDGITNKLATLYWNDKKSGADITVSYTFTPIVKNLAEKPTMIQQGTTNKLITTPYSLGNTIGGYYIDKALSLDGDVEYRYVLYNQGIYIFTLTDEAGNSCKYVLIIDNSEAYFRVHKEDQEIRYAEFVSRVNIKSPKTVYVYPGTHKAIKIGACTAGSTDAEKEFNNIISGKEDYVNKSKQYNMFFGFVEGQYYITVKNKSLSSYKYSTGNTVATDVNADNNGNYSIKLTDENSNSTIRRMYLVGANQRDIKPTASNSYIMVEINTDNAQGTVYASSSKEVFYDTTGKLTFDNLDRANEISTGKNIHGAEATSDAYVAFTWNTGATSADYEVVKLTLKHYTLRLDTAIFDTNFYYYDDQDGAFTESVLYQKDVSVDPSVIFNDGNNKGMAIIKVSNNQTAEGLYVLTREYSGSGSDTDGKERNYYFIVDRNGIITSGIHGGNISIGLLDNETRYNQFTSMGGNEGVFSYTDNNYPEKSITEKKYNIYFTTNKVPSVINVPLYKYFDTVDKASKYEINSGGLDIALYFKNTYSQLSNDVDRTIKLFDSTDETFTYIDNDGFFSFSIWQSLSDDYKARFSNQNKITENSWICLPGDYILIIRDRVKSGSMSYSHEKTIGFQITYNAPSIGENNLFSAENTTYDSGNGTRVDLNTYKLVTNDRYIKMIIPEYIDTLTNAQIDPDYVMINNKTTGKPVVNYPYQSSGTNTIVPDRAKGATVVWDTMSRDYGKQEEFSTQEYTVTIRYRLWRDDAPSAGQDPKYMHCYYYITNGESTKYESCYEVTYTVIVDREAPRANVDALQEGDKLLASNVQLFENYSYTVNAYERSYVYQYNYYTDREIGFDKVYAFVADSKTAFNPEGISVIYSNDIGDTKTAEDKLTLPKTQYSGTAWGIGSTIVSYGQLGLQSGKYYEIIELDAAGNATQYVVYYVNSLDSIKANNVNLSLLEGQVVTPSGNLTVNKSAPYTFAWSSGDNKETHTVLSYEGSGFGTMGVSLGAGVDKFLHIEISDLSNIVSRIDTNLTTKFDESGLGQTIAGKINSLGYGNYVITLHTRNDNVSMTINYLTSNEPLVVDRETMIENGELVFSAANRLSADGSYYLNYAKRIEVAAAVESSITGVYEPDPASNFTKYMKESGTSYYRVTLQKDVTYIITVTDAFDRVQTLQVNLTLSEFQSLQFGHFDESGEFVEQPYIRQNGVYYSYHGALLLYEPTVYEANIVKFMLDNDNRISDPLMDELVNDKITIGKMSAIYISPYWSSTYAGGLLNIEIALSLGGDTEEIYTIMIDSRTASVTLLNMKSEPQSMSITINGDHTDTHHSVASSGTLNLTWNTFSNDYFLYVYKLHKEKDDGSFDSEQKKVNHAIINVESGYTGKYVFEIEIYTAKGVYIGNKLYTFMVNTIIGQLYYVQTKSGMAVGTNSVFYFYDESGNWNLNPISEGKVSQALGLYDTTKLSRNEVLLYISNEELEVVYEEDRAQCAGVNYEFTLKDSNNTQVTESTVKFYRVYTSTYSVFLATLYVQPVEHGGILSTVSLNKGNGAMKPADFNILSDLSYTIYQQAVPSSDKGTDIGEVSLTFNRYKSGASHLLSKLNIITVDVYHNNIFVDTYDSFEVDSLGRSVLTIQGSGKFKFVFRDLAGNVHRFGASVSSQDYIDITVLKDMVINIGSSVAVNDAHYNDSITLSVWDPTLYDPGTIALVSAFRNGEPYQPEKALYSYTFSDYGTYRVKFQAKYNNVLISKIITFTLVNEKEARESIDLSSIANHTIKSVKNASGDNVTAAFLSIIRNNAVENGMNLTYDTLLEHVSDLGISWGKQTFTITYEVHDQMYPKKEITFAFTLNNELPTIEMSLANGESTTKSVTIKFNASLIYEQVGECEIYLNDTLLMSIDEHASTELTELVVSRTQYGAGNHYLRIQSKSGNVIDSFKIVLRDPLNTSSIIVIIVVTGVVLAIAITIITLRKKMRVR